MDDDSSTKRFLILSIISVPMFLVVSSAQASIILSNQTSAIWQKPNGEYVEVYFQCNSSCQQVVRIRDYESSIFFYLYTRNNPHGITITPYNSENFDKFIKGADIKIIIHGYWSAYNAGLGPIMKDAYFNNTDQNPNLILVDWSELASTWWYPWAVEYTKDVANYTRKLIDFLRSKEDIIGNNVKIHCIGHSLGAHVCGHTNKNLKAEQRKVERITGLDPAGVGYQTCDDIPCSLYHPEVRLAKDDADLVDIIHTDVWGWGIQLGIGHLDFYANGDVNRQPACPFPDVTCSHSIAYKYFAESIMNPFAYFGCIITNSPPDMPKFGNYSCGDVSMIPMGYSASVSEIPACGDTTVVHIRTRNDSPYGCKRNINCDETCSGSRVNGGEVRNLSFRPTYSHVNTTIIGGAEAEEGEFPWIVSIIRSYGSNKSHVCAGILVKPNKILTAAHCINNSSAPYMMVMAGIHNLSLVSGSEQISQISYVDIHPEYSANNGMQVNDIAIITTERSFNITQDNPHIQLARLGKLDFQPNTQGILTVAGWGRTGASQNLSQVLQKVGVVRTSCSINYNRELPGWICAGSGAAGACQGDSGGPLHKSDGSVVGLVSFGGEKCDSTTVFMNFNRYDVWISHGIQTNKCGPTATERGSRNKTKI